MNIQIKDHKDISYLYGFIINDIVIRQPLSYNVVNDFTDSPPFGLYDILFTIRLIISYLLFDSLTMFID